jgi:transcription antitermination factor NusG
MTRCGGVPPGAPPDGRPMTSYLIARTARQAEHRFAAAAEVAGVASYLPLVAIPVRSRHRRSGAVSISRVPAFPGYVFVADTPAEWRRMDGFRRFLTVRGGPVVMDAAALERVRQMEAEWERAAMDRHGPKVTARLRPGDRVEVLHGVIAGERGTVIEVGGAWVLVEFTNGWPPVKVRAEHLIQFH